MVGWRRILLWGYDNLRRKEQIMGARTNFTFKQGDQYLTLYSHWGGDSKFQDLAYAINEAKPRWGDTGYCTKIIVSQLIGESWNETSGFGLYAGDKGSEESYDPVTIDVEKLTVETPDLFFTFEEFIKANRI